ncbi:hypothetical protein HID58_075614, partial [Brassica napus]
MVSSLCDYTTSNGLSIPDNSHVNVNRISIDTAPGQREKEMRRITSLTVRRVSPLHCVWEDLLVQFSVYYVVVVVSYCFQVRDAGNLLTRAGFSLPGVDVDDYVVKYKSALDLIDHLRAMGETNALLHRNKACFSFFLSSILNRETALATAAIYDSMFTTEDGTIPATFQVIYMTGWREHSLLTRRLSGEVQPPYPSQISRSNLVLTFEGTFRKKKTETLQKRLRESVTTT